MAEKTLELMSVLGVGVIGFGLGALFADMFKPSAYLIVLIGIMMHALAMYKLHSGNREESAWVKFLYWLCWGILAILAIYIANSIR